MKKSELADRMVVELRNGDRYMVVGDMIMSDIYFISFRSFDENLLAEYGLKEYDIMKIYNQVHSLNEIETTKDLLWKRPKEVIYTEKELEILKALKVLGYKWIARDIINNLNAYKGIPRLEGGYWFGVEENHLYYGMLTNIKYEDKKPHNINEMLK